MPVQVDQERLMHELETLASFSDAPAPAVTRVVFSKADLESRAYLNACFAKLGWPFVRTPSAIPSRDGLAPNRNLQR